MKEMLMNRHEHTEQEPVLKPEARKALDAAIEIARPAQPGLNAPTMNRIHRAVAGISMDRLRLMIADGQVTSQEARMALMQEGLSAEEVDMALEYTRRVLEQYARGAVPEEHSLAAIGALLNTKVKKFGTMIASGNIFPGIKKQSKAEAVAPATTGEQRSPEAKELPPR